MENIIEEGEIKGAIDPASLLQTKTILTQMEKSVCKITSDKCGTGFFCKIELNKVKIPVLITNYHIINDKMIENERDVKIKLGNEPVLKVIKLNKRRRIYSSNIKQYDIMILRIYEKDDDLNTVNYLEIDDYLLNKNSELSYEDSSIYILHYPSASDVKVSYGYGIQSKNQNNIIHKCKTLNGSSGAPILNLLSNKVIGIHKSFVVYKEKNKENTNLGTSLKYVLLEMNKKLTKKFNEQQYSSKKLPKKLSLAQLKEKYNTNITSRNEKEKKGKNREISNSIKINLINDMNNSYCRERLKSDINEYFSIRAISLLFENIKNKKFKITNKNKIDSKSSFQKDKSYIIKNKKQEIEKETEEEDMPNLNINNEIKKKNQEENNINDNMKEKIFYNPDLNNNTIKNNYLHSGINIISERKRNDKDKLVSLNNNSYQNMKNFQLDFGKKSYNFYKNSKIISSSPYKKKLKNHSFVFIKQANKNE